MIAVGITMTSQHLMYKTQRVGRNHRRLRKAWEATSSSPSSIHFGHYMAGTFNPTIVVFNARLANLGFTTGYSLKCWCQGLNVMLENRQEIST